MKYFTVKVCFMTIHHYNGGPEVCFTAVDFTEEWDFFKICYFVDRSTFRQMFLGETNSLKCPLLWQLLQVTSFAGNYCRLYCCPPHHIHLRSGLDRVPFSGFMGDFESLLWGSTESTRVGLIAISEIALPRMRSLFCFRASAWRLICTAISRVKSPLVWGRSDNASSTTPTTIRSRIRPSFSVPYSQSSASLYKPSMTVSTDSPANWCRLLKKICCTIKLRRTSK